jgi:DME family drug/metabolite transporter
MSPPPTSHTTRGFVFIALSAILFGSIGVATRGIFNSADTNALSITLWRALIALPVLFAISFFLLGKKLFAIRRRDLRVMILAGLMMTIYQAGFVLAVRMISVTIATLVTLGTVPVFAALLSALVLHERLHPQVYFALACALVGLVFLVGFQPGEKLGTNVALGIFFSLLTAVGSASFQICGRVLANRYHPLQTLTVFFFIAALALLPVTLWSGFVINYPPVSWALLLHLGIGVSVLGYAFLILGLRTTPATIATIIALFEPLTGALLAWLLLGERLGASGLFGAVLLLGAMLMVMRSHAPAAEPAEV